MSLKLTEYQAKAREFLQLMKPVRGDLKAVCGIGAFIGLCLVGYVFSDLCQKNAIQEQRIANNKLVLEMAGKESAFNTAYEAGDRKTAIKYCDEWKRQVPANTQLRRRYDLLGASLSKRFERRCEVLYYLDEQQRGMDINRFVQLNPRKTTN